MTKTNHRSSKLAACCGVDRRRASHFGHTRSRPTAGRYACGALGYKCASRRIGHETAGALRGAGHKPRLLVASAAVDREGLDFGPNASVCLVTKVRANRSGRNVPSAPSRRDLQRSIFHVCIAAWRLAAGLHDGVALFQVARCAKKLKVLPDREPAATVGEDVVHVERSQLSSATERSVASRASYASVSVHEYDDSDVTPRGWKPARSRVHVLQRHWGRILHAKTLRTASRIAKSCA